MAAAPIKEAVKYIDLSSKKERVISPKRFARRHNFAQTQHPILVA